MKLNMKISSLLKQLFIALALVGGVGVNVAQAVSTTYNFSFNAANGLYSSGGYFISDGSSLTGGGGNLVGSGPNPSGGFTGTYAMTNFTQRSGGPSYLLFRFTANSVVYTANYNAQDIDPYPSNGALSYSPSGGTTVTSVFSSQSAPAAAGAPEIDGSLAPKVGFLLGCLFLMFGRKKQNTEPMMMA